MKKSNEHIRSICDVSTSRTTRAANPLGGFCTTLRIFAFPILDIQPGHASLPGEKKVRRIPSSGKIPQQSPSCTEPRHRVQSTRELYIQNHSDLPSQKNRNLLKPHMYQGNLIGRTSCSLMIQAFGLGLSFWSSKKNVKKMKYMVLVWVAYDYKGNQQLSENKTTINNQRNEQLPIQKNPPVCHLCLVFYKRASSARFYHLLWWVWNNRANRSCKLDCKAQSFGKW
jgi:hypothetical protein